MSNKTKIVFIHPPLTFEDRYGDSKEFTGHIHPPQGLCHLAAMFPADKYDVSIIDSQALFMGIDATVTKVRKFAPDYIGIMTFTISIHTVAILYGKLKKEVPDVKIIIGGPHITACPHETFERFPLFDMAVLHEGEHTFPELIDCLEKNDDVEMVKGILYRKDTGDIIHTGQRPYVKDLDALPRPRWDLLPSLPQHYRPSTMTYRKLPAVAIVTSRGCPYECTFCDRSVFGRKWRAHSPETVLDWVGYLTAEYGIRDINFQDDHFMVAKRRLKTICEGIIRNYPDLLWSTIGRADAVDVESIQIMKKAGCWQIAFGIESGSQRVLDTIQKNETIEQIEYAVRITREAGITVKGLFMAGCPTETEASLKKTEKFIRKLKLDYVSMSAFTPIPNTKVHAQWQKYGRWEGGGPDDWEKMNLWEPVFIPHGLTRAILKKYIKRAPVKK